MLLFCPTGKSIKISFSGYEGAGAVFFVGLNVCLESSLKEQS